MLRVLLKAVHPNPTIVSIPRDFHKSRYSRHSWTNFQVLYETPENTYVN